MADDQGKGWHSDNEGEHQRHVEAGREAAKTAEERHPGIHAEAGKKGGEATRESHDETFYEEIGSMGGKASPTKFKSGDERTKEAGRKGGSR